MATRKKTAKKRSRRSNARTNKTSNQQNYDDLQTIGLGNVTPNDNAEVHPTVNMKDIKQSKNVFTISGGRISKRK